MSSLLDVRLGAQVPQIQHLPPGVHSLAAADEAIELADSYLICDGNPLAESQRITLRAACGEREDGSWAAARVGDFGPRQGTGKNDKINARELAGLILFGERLIIHTAHEFPTANESFLRMVAIFDAWDDLRKKVARIRYANGEQGIELLSGQRLKYRARTGGSGRGFAKADLVVYDESQHLARSHVAASGPAKLANPNSQSWYAGSGGFSTSQVAWEMRRQAILGTGGRLAYTEMTGEQIEVVNGKARFTPPDPDDREVWYSTIPGLGRWVTEEGVETMRDELGQDFAREGLCVWDPEPGTESARWVSVAEPDWRACRSGGPLPRPAAWSVDVDENTDGKVWSSIACAEPDAFDLVDVGEGTAWVVNRLRALSDSHGFSTVALNPDGLVGQLRQSIIDAGFDVVDISGRKFAAATEKFLTAVRDRTVRYPAIDGAGGRALDVAAAGAVTRDAGDGASAWSRKASIVDIGPVVAATCALWAVESGGPPGYYGSEE